MKNDYRRKQDSGRYDHETTTYTLEASPPVEGVPNKSRPTKPPPATMTERMREFFVPGSAKGVTGSQNKSENEQLKKRDY